MSPDTLQMFHTHTHTHTHQPPGTGLRSAPTQPLLHQRHWTSSNPFCLNAGQGGVREKPHGQDAPHRGGAVHADGAHGVVDAQPELDPEMEAMGGHQSFDIIIERVSERKDVEGWGRSSKRGVSRCREYSVSSHRRHSRHRSGGASSSWCCRSRSSDHS